MLPSEKRREHETQCRKSLPESPCKNARYLARKMRLESIPVAREQGGAGIEHVPQPTCTRIQSLANREGASGIDTMPTIATLGDQSRYVLKSPEKCVL